MKPLIRKPCNIQGTINIVAISKSLKRPNKARTILINLMKDKTT